MFGLHASSASAQQMQSNRLAHKQQQPHHHQQQLVYSYHTTECRKYFSMFFSKMQNKTKCHNHNHINCFISSTQFHVVVLVVAIVFAVPNSFAMHSAYSEHHVLAARSHSNFYSIILAKIMAKCEQCQLQFAPPNSFICVHSHTRFIHHGFCMALMSTMKHQKNHRIFF